MVNFRFHNGLRSLEGCFRRQTGFTLIELLVVMVVIALLLTLVSPRYFESIQRSKETILKQNLHTLRDVIDKYYADNGHYPNQLSDLVTNKYIREIPKDPVTDSRNTWIVVPPANSSLGSVYDVHSGAPGQGRDGSPYKKW
jgi:general secretion pathway protein G